MLIEDELERQINESTNVGWAIASVVRDDVVKAIDALRALRKADKARADLARAVILGRLPEDYGRDDVALKRLAAIAREVLNAD